MSRTLVSFLLIVFAHTSFAQFENNPLSQAVDNTQFNFVNDSPGFYSQTSVFSFDGDAAASQKINDDQEAIMATQFQDVYGKGGTIIFDWKVSSEATYDFLAFLIVDQGGNIVKQRQISGEKDWVTEQLIIPSGNYTLAWGYVKDGSVSAGADRGYVDNVRIRRNGAPLPPECVGNGQPLNTALDNSSLTFTNFSGSTNQLEFICQLDPSAENGASAFSIAGSNDSSQLWVNVNGLTDLVFNWRLLGGQNNSMKVEVYNGDQRIKNKGNDYFGELNSSGDWESFRLRVPKDATRVRWVYINKSTPGTAALDNIQLEEATVDPAVLSILPSIFLMLLED